MSKNTHREKNFKPTINYSLISSYGLEGLKEGGGGGGGGLLFHRKIFVLLWTFLGSMADILGQFFGESSFGGHPFGGLFGHSMGGGGRPRRRKGDDMARPLK